MPSFEIDGQIIKLDVIASDKKLNYLKSPKNDSSEDSDVMRKHLTDSSLINENVIQKHQSQDYSSKPKFSLYLWNLSWNLSLSDIRSKITELIHSNIVFKIRLGINKNTGYFRLFI